jgi:hypothetical protein
MVVLVPTAHTVDNGYALRSGAVLKHNLTTGGSGGAYQPLKLKAGDNVI